MKNNICIQKKCIKCCLETSMLLSNSDIQNIENIGYKKKNFVRINNRWFYLKNKNGRCVFHNGKKCMIYDNRPEGCKLYPLIFDEEHKKAIVDKDCPYDKIFKFNKKDVNQLFSLVNKIFNEWK